MMMMMMFQHEIHEFALFDMLLWINRNYSQRIKMPPLPRRRERLMLLEENFRSGYGKAMLAIFKSHGGLVREDY